MKIDYGTVYFSKNAIYICKLATTVTDKLLADWDMWNLVLATLGL